MPSRVWCRYDLPSTDGVAWSLWYSRTNARCARYLPLQHAASRAVSQYLNRFGKIQFGVYWARVTCGTVVKSASAGIPSLGAPGSSCLAAA